MALRLGGLFPNIKSEAYDESAGGKTTLQLYDYIGDKWCIFFSHPADYTPVCTTELAEAVRHVDEFSARNCKLLAISCNDYASHEGWSKDIMAYAKHTGPFPFPIMIDELRTIAISLGIIDPVEKDSLGVPVSCRALFFLSPDKKIAAKLMYPATTGRSFKEILRVLDSLQMTAKHPVATPEGWEPGMKCMVLPTLSEEKAATELPKGIEHIAVPSEKKYLRLTADPTA